MGRMSGFRQVNQDEEADIDAKLEDYFLNNRSKFEEQFEEYKTYADGSQPTEPRAEKKEDTKVEKEIQNIQKVVEKKTGTPKKQAVAVVKTPAKEIELKTKTPVKATGTSGQKPGPSGQKKSANGGLGGNPVV